MALSGDTFQLVYKYLCYRIQISIKLIPLHLLLSLISSILTKQYISAANFITENRIFLADVAKSCKSVPCSAGITPWREDTINTRAVLKSFEICEVEDLKLPHL